MSWAHVKLADICDLQNGYAFKSADYVESSDTLSCRMSNIRPGGIFDITSVRDSRTLTPLTYCN